MGKGRRQHHYANENVEQKHSYKLFYADTRGRAEPIRLIFHYFRTRFEDVRMTREEAAEQMLKAPMQQLPYLEIDNGKTVLCQTLAICRYLGKSIEPDLWFGGSTKTDSAKVDMYADAFADIFQAAQVAVYSDAEIKEHLMAQTKSFVRKRLMILESNLKASRGDYFVGKKVHWCDLYVLGVLGVLEEFDDSLLDDLSDLRKYYLRMRNVPQIKDYIENEWPPTSYKP